LRVGVIGLSLCLLMPSVSLDIDGFCEFGEFAAILLKLRKFSFNRHIISS